MMNNPLEFCGAALSFAGGVVLTWETLSVKNRTKEESGARRLLEVLARIGAPDTLRDAKGNSLSDERALQLWFAERTFRWGWAGFLLMASGFLLEMIGGW